MVLDDHTDRAKVLIEAKRQITKISTACKTLDRLMVGPESQARALTVADTESLRVTLAEVKGEMLESARRVRSLGHKLHDNHTTLECLIKRREKRRADNRAAVRVALTRAPGETSSRAKVVAVLTNVNADVRHLADSAPTPPSVTPPACVTPEPQPTPPGQRPWNPPRPVQGTQPATNERLLSPRVPRRRVTAPPRGGFAPRGSSLSRGQPALRGGFGIRTAPN
jgi:hypothetical protein